MFRILLFILFITFSSLSFDTQVKYKLNKVIINDIPMSLEVNMYQGSFPKEVNIILKVDRKPKMVIIDHEIHEYDYYEDKLKIKISILDFRKLIQGLSYIKIFFDYDDVNLVFSFIPKVRDFYFFLEDIIYKYWLINIKDKLV